jgi:methylmalonyl-CoA mutase, N-terminal domain
MKEQNSSAGEFPFRSGIHQGMYTTKPWTIRQYSGFGAPEQTNRRFKELIAEGVTGLSIAFDLPTQMGLDPDHELATGEVGKIGVSISDLDDMRALLADIQLDQISVSMTINSTASIIYLMYCIVAEERGFKLEDLRGTIQNDILKEYISRNTFIFGPEFSMFLTTGLIRYAIKNTPKWNPISISGYHMSEAGATNVQELAFTFSNAIAYIDDLLIHGLSIDEIAPRLSFFFSANLNIIEEVAKFRAARHVYAELIQEKFKPKSELSTRLRFHVQTAGSELRAEKPELNLARVTIQALAAVLGGTQSLHTNSYDEALSLPTDFSASLAVDTQIVMQQETDLLKYVDPFQGSEVVEALTDQLVLETRRIMAEISNLGGAISAIKGGYQKASISAESLKVALAFENKSRNNVRISNSKERNDAFQNYSIEKSIQQGSAYSEKNKHSRRDLSSVSDLLSRIENHHQNAIELLQQIKDALIAGATLGEIVIALKKQEQDD